jgi:serine/threonine protein kinase
MFCDRHLAVCHRPSSRIVLDTVARPTIFRRFKSKRPTRDPLRFQALPQKQYNHLLRVTERLNNADKLWKYGDVDELRESVLPRAVDVVVDRERRRYIFTPVHYGSLHSFIQSRKQRLNEDDIRPLFRQIVRIVAFCHRLGLVVRDLKLRKFVFTDRAQTRLRLNGVFDLIACANITDDGMRDRHCCPAYASPEILSMDRQMYSGKSADVWSLGVLLFVVLIGRYPFYDSTPQGLFTRIRTGQFTIPPDATISFAARALIHALLRRDPKERPTADALLASPWLVTKPRVDGRTTSTIGLGARKPFALTSNDGDDQLVPFVETIA